MAPGIGDQFKFLYNNDTQKAVKPRTRKYFKEKRGFECKFATQCSGSKLDSMLYVKVLQTGAIVGCFKFFLKVAC